MENVRIRVERRMDARLSVTVTMPNGVYFPLDVSDRDLSDVTVGKSYDCDWTKDGQFLNLRDTPLPAFNEQHLKAIRRYMALISRKSEVI